MQKYTIWTSCLNCLLYNSIPIVVLQFSNLFKMVRTPITVNNSPDWPLMKRRCVRLKSSCINIKVMFNSLNQINIIPSNILTWFLTGCWRFLPPKADFFKMCKWTESIIPTETQDGAREPRRNMTVWVKDIFNKRMFLKLWNLKKKSFCWNLLLISLGLYGIIVDIFLWLSQDNLRVLTTWKDIYKEEWLEEILNCISLSYKTHFIYSPSFVFSYGVPPLSFNIRMCIIAHNASLAHDKWNHSVNSLSKRITNEGGCSCLNYLLVTMWLKKCIHFLDSFVNIALNT